MTTTIKFKNIYGNSYFGSGGGFGRVEKSSFNYTVAGYGDNGFVYGPQVFTPADPDSDAFVSAVGGDDIGNGRKWSECAYYLASDRRWFGGCTTPEECHDYKDRAGRMEAERMWDEIGKWLMRERFARITESLAKCGVVVACWDYVRHCVWVRHSDDARRGILKDRALGPTAHYWVEKNRGSVRFHSDMSINGSQHSVHLR